MMRARQHVNVSPNPQLVTDKIGDYGVRGYEAMLVQAIDRLPCVVNSPEFKAQMTRFIDSSIVARTLDREGYLDYLSSSVGQLFSAMRAELAGAVQATQPQAKISSATRKPVPELEQLAGIAKGARKGGVRDRKDRY